MVRVSPLASLKGAATAWAGSFLGLGLGCLVLVAGVFSEGGAGVVADGFCDNFSCFMADLAGAGFPAGRAVSLFRFAMVKSVVVLVLMGRRLFLHCPTFNLRLRTCTGNF